jgi:hypothetical protein
MSGYPPLSATTSVWPRTTGSSAADYSGAGPIPLGGGSMGLPTINNSNLPPAMNQGGFGNQAPPIPQVPRTPFPTLQQPLGAGNSLNSNNYATANTLPSFNSMPTNFVCKLYNK